LTDFEQYFARCRDQVSADLEAWLPQTGQINSPLHDAIRYSVLNGGKRIRPLLVYASADCYDLPATEVTPIAAAVELIHAYSLVHDDLPAMDDDDLRRGKPTCHIAFDEATAILAGDGLQTLAFQRLTEASAFSADQRLLMVQTLAHASGALGMVAGQAIDLAAVNQSLTLAQLEDMHNRKTGALIRASVELGAIAGAASSSEMTALQNYADAIGLAFQVQDDILDITANTQTLGKQQGADAALNKPTYPSLLGLEGARQKAGELYQEAMDAIAPFGKRAAHLQSLANYIIKRDY